MKGAIWLSVVAQQRDLNWFANVAGLLYTTLNSTVPVLNN